ncbi:MAG: hypothetical protein U0931_28460 [Vulcanimicrobiota bacterium]
MTDATLNRLETDEDQLADVLQRWIAAAHSNTDNLTHQSQNVDVAHSDLNAALNHANQKAGELHNQANHLNTSAQTMINDLTSAEKNLAQDLDAGANQCQKYQSDLCNRAHELETEAGTASRLLAAAHASVGAAVNSAGQSRQAYSQATQGHHQAAHSFLDQSKTHLSQHGTKIQGSSHAAAGQLGTFHSELDHHANVPVKSSVNDTVHFLSNDYHKNLSDMVTQRLQATLAEVNKLTGGVNHFSGEFSPLGQQVQKLATDVAKDMPDMLKKQGVDPVVNTAKDLVVRQLVNTAESILIGVGLSTALVGAMPVLKVVSAALRAMMNLTNLIQHGELMPDEADKYVDDPVELAKSLQSHGVGQNVKPGLADLVDQAVLKVDGSLALVVKTAQSMKDEVQNMVNQGAQAAKEYIEELLCPLCGAHCEVIEA